MRRIVTPELLDSDSILPEEVARSLSDLRMVNRWFGGIRTTVALLKAAAPAQRSISLLDVGSGCGYETAAVRQQLQRDGVHLDCTLLDRKLAHLQLSDSVRVPPARRIVADALALPFKDTSFDYVSCTLFAHHLEPEELKAFVEEALRVCRVAVLINDLRRNALSLALVYAGFPLFRSSLSRHDGVASVRRAYTIPEMEDMLARTQAARVEISRYYLFRMGVIVWKKQEPIALPDNEHFSDIVSAQEELD